MTIEGTQYRDFGKLQKPRYHERKPVIDRPRAADARFRCDLRLVGNVAIKPRMIQFPLAESNRRPQAWRAEIGGLKRRTCCGD